MNNTENQPQSTTNSITNWQVEFTDHCRRYAEAKSAATLASVAETELSQTIAALQDALNDATQHWTDRNSLHASIEAERQSVQSLNQKVRSLVSNAHALERSDELPSVALCFGSAVALGVARRILRMRSEAHEMTREAVRTQTKFAKSLDVTSPWEDGSFKDQTWTYARTCELSRLSLLAFRQMEEAAGAMTELKEQVLATQLKHGGCVLAAREAKAVQSVASAMLVSLLLKRCQEIDVPE